MIVVLKFTCVHRLSQRGHDETAGSANAGNSLDLLQLIGQHNDLIGERLVETPRIAKYTSNDIQNELIDIMARMIRSAIVEEVRESGEFSVMADESKDCRKVDQMSVVFRYLFCGSVYERFVGFVPAADLSADGPYSELVSQMQTLALDYKNRLVGQGYDDASVMSGRHRGVA